MDVKVDTNVEITVDTNVDTEINGNTNNEINEYINVDPLLEIDTYDNDAKVNTDLETNVEDKTKDNVKDTIDLKVKMCTTNAGHKNKKENEMPNAEKRRRTS